MTFKLGDEVFSYDAMASEETLRKESKKYVGQYFTAELIRETPKHLRAIWIAPHHGAVGTHYLNYINLNKMRPETTPMFHNHWRHVSLNKDYVKELTLGEGQPTEEEMRKVIKFFFEEEL